MKISLRWIRKRKEDVSISLTKLNIIQIFFFIFFHDCITFKSCVSFMSVYCFEYVVLNYLTFTYHLHNDLRTALRHHLKQLAISNKRTYLEVEKYFSPTAWMWKEIQFKGNNNRILNSYTKAFKTKTSSNVKYVINVKSNTSCVKHDVHYKDETIVSHFLIPFYAIKLICHSFHSFDSALSHF